MKIFEFFEVLTLKMALSAIIIIIFIISASKYSNIQIDNKIGELSLLELYPKFFNFHKKLINTPLNWK